jgi:PKD repeat protein
MRISLSLAAALIAIAIVPGGSALADHGQPGLDPSKLEYEPIGFFKPGDTIPPNEPLTPTNGLKYNPSGNYNAFDTNFFETVTWPYRGAGDTTDNDAPGNGGNPKHGFCAPNPVPRPPTAPLSAVAGECPNHQLEFIKYYEETMRDILGDFGMTFRRYEFTHSGGTNTSGGTAINPAAVVPGVDHPEEEVVIGAHYDKTTEGPASTWDSQEGHAQMIRVAKIMADYWNATGTRPSATVKFIPWDGEESGTFGSADYADKNIVPGEEDRVRAYFNTDPCAGGYPAYRFGNPEDRVNLGIQIADENEIADFPTDRVTAFNPKAQIWTEQVFDRLDDTLALDAGEREIYVSPSEAGPGKPSDIGTAEAQSEVNVGKARPTIFTSDWRNFEAKGVPFYNPGPEVTGPDTENNPNNADALAILHTPNDNQNTLNTYTASGPTGLSGTTFSEGWIKGMEMCSHLLAHGMLQPEMGGGQANNGDVVAYYEALPNEALQNQNVRFNASGSYQYANVATREKVPADQLEYLWDFGDGTTGTGQEVQHGYADIGVYQSTLTVRNRVTGQSDTLGIPITVIGSNFDPPVLTKPTAEDEDGTFPLDWTFEGTREGFERFRVEEANDYVIGFSDDANAAPEDKWQVDAPTNPGIAPWQSSDSSTPKVRGDQAREGKSYWTGVPASQNNPAPGGGTFPEGPQVIEGESVMTLKQRFTVPRGSASLQFHSVFQMEGDDRGIVQIASAEAPEQFDEVYTIQAVNTAAGQQDHRTCDPSTPGTFTEGTRPYSIDIGQYAGKEILLRFRLSMGAENRAASQPCGWYVDDISVGSGTFKPIGEALDPEFQVRDRAKGTYAYRVRGVYNDGVQTASSNTESVVVTTGVDQSGGPGGGGPGGGGTARSCEPTDGFEAVKVTPLQQGRRLKFDFARRSLQPVRIDVFQMSIGRRVIKGKRVARFAPGDRSVRWNAAAPNGKQVRPGFYFVRFRVRQADGRTDIRRVTLRRRGGRFRVVRRFYGRVSCALLASAKLRSPVFGGRNRVPLRIAYIVTRRSRVTVTIHRGKRRVRVIRRRSQPERVTHRLRIRPNRLKRRGQYRVRIVARRGTRVERTTLWANRL